ncbi:hypothetical protein [Aquimarina mytili]|uniref:Fibronectin type-III domain-containing protein n=1 Tax=Aquimarina mytili TaxID=874423 RepID=A0A936ZUM2_9FLAO|nr:hypothetical protein [Aquimarina mytili]MBL0685682.1 hypothetical protein [Aquimarina mytili]
MKKIYITICTVLLLFSCTEEETILVDSLQNLSVDPTTPGLVYPTNNLVCTNFNLEFQWTTSTTITLGKIGYQVEIATDATFNQIVFTTTTTEPTATFTLEQGTLYYWRVKAFDSKGYKSPYSRIQTFITEPEATTNTIPSISSTATPAVSELLRGNTATLGWNATDGDNDPLLFDVYFGESNPPQLFAENLNAMTLDVQIEANKTYYWRVVAKDDKQGVAIGRVWNFRTE